MKKIIFTIALAGALSFSAAAQQALKATVVSTTGKVEILKGTSWEPVTKGTELSRGDIISTGFNSEAVLSIKNTTVKLASLTRMTVEQLAENDVKEQAQFFIDTGKVSANVKHAENKRTDFKVRSPVSTASVRGTDFSMRATGKISTNEGIVATSPSTSQTAQISESDKPSDYLPPEAVSSVFTSTADVGGEGGVPVYAGQSTSTDEATGRVVSPQLSMVSDSVSVGGFTAATGDSISDSGLAALSSTTSSISGSDSIPANSDSGPSGPSTGNLTIRLKLSE